MFIDTTDQNVEDLYLYPTQFHSNAFTISIIPNTRLLYVPHAAEDFSTFFEFPSIKCTDSQASDCELFDNTVSTGCLGGGTLNGGTCECPPPSGTPVTGNFFNTASSNCEACASGCENCTVPLAADCTSCPAGSTFTGTQCVCNGAFWLDLGGGSPGTCESCFVDCSKCTGPTNGECTDCVSPKVLDSGSCVDPPPPPPSPSPSSSSGGGEGEFSVDDTQVNYFRLTQPLRNGKPFIDISDINAFEGDERITHNQGNTPCSPENYRTFTDLLDGQCKNCD